MNNNDIHEISRKLKDNLKRKDMMKYPSILRVISNGMRSSTLKNNIYVSMIMKSLK